MPLAVISFLTSIAYLPGITSAAYAPRWWVLLVGAPLCLLATPRIRMTTGHWWGMAFLLVCAESLAWSVSQMDTINALIQLLALAMVFCVASECADLEPVWLALGLGAAVNTAVSFIQYAGYALVIQQGSAGLFFQQDFFGAFCATSLVGLLFGVTHHRKLAGLLICWCAIGLALSHCRGALLAVAVALAVAGIRALGRNTTQRAIMAVAAALVGAAGLYWQYHAMPARQGAINIRFIEWDMVTQNLHWLGWGLGTVGSVFSFEHAENEFVELAFELGMLSLLFWGLVIHAMRKATHARAAFLVLVALLVDGLTSFPLRNPATALMAAVAFGHLCGVGHGLRRAGLQSPNFGGLYFVEPTPVRGFKDPCRTDRSLPA